MREVFLRFGPSWVFLPQMSAMTSKRAEGEVKKKKGGGRGERGVKGNNSLIALLACQCPIRYKNLADSEELLTRPDRPCSLGEWVEGGGEGGGRGGNDRWKLAGGGGGLGRGGGEERGEEVKRKGPTSR